MAENWAARLETLDLTVAAPQHRVLLTARGSRDVRVSLAPGYYDRATSIELARDLTSAARLMVELRARVLRDGLGGCPGPSAVPDDARLRRDSAEFRRRLEQIVVAGEAADGRVRVSSIGPSDLAVWVAPGISSSMSEYAFTSSCREAALAFLADHVLQVSDVRFDVYVRPGLEAAGVR